jgi:mannitol-1-/sugar-/sorbitol-6-phosphatase
MTRIVCRGLLLDMDGVLVDSTPAVARVWSKWALKQGMNPEAVVKQAHGRTSITTIQELLPKADAEAHRLEDRWMEQAEIEDVADVVALPGAKQLLKLIPTGQLAVVTSATRALAEVRLRAAGLLELVTYVITASDIQRGKPDPEPYRKGAAKLSLDPQDCIVIEDAPSGVISGKAAGARVIALRTTCTDSELLSAGAEWLLNDCSSIQVNRETAPGKVVLTLSENGKLPHASK